MLVIERQLGGIPRKFDVYEPGEECPYKAVYWKELEEGNPQGLWAITDDDYKCEVVRVAKYRINQRSRRFNCYVKLAIGANYARGANKIVVGDYLNAGNGYSYVKPDRWANRMTRKRNVKDTVTAYVQMMFAGKIEWNVLGRIYRPKDYIPAASVKRLFKQQEIRNMVKQEIKEHLQSLGINEQFVIEKIKSALELAELNEDPNNMLKAIPFLEKYLEMEPKQQKLTESVEFDFREIEDGIEKEGSLKASRETVRPLTAGDIVARNGSVNDSDKFVDLADTEYETIS